jgi:hypothetical protein
MTRYFGGWREETYRCPLCHWEGAGALCEQGEASRDSFEIVCPECGEKVGAVMFPTVEECRLNWDRVDDARKRQVEAVEIFSKRFEERKLKSADQLPDIGGGSFTLAWGYEGSGADGETVIRHGDSVLWREPALYDGCDRFAEVAGILKSRYGRRLRDLIPAPGSLEFLYGGRWSAIDIVRKARQSLGGEESPPGPTS